MLQTLIFLALQGGHVFFLFTQHGAPLFRLQKVGEFVGAAMGKSPNTEFDAWFRIKLFFFN